MTLLKVENLNAGYGRLQILFDISMDVEEEEIVVIVGPNGSGKSTLLKTIFGLTTIYSGVVRLFNRNITGLKPHQIARMGVVYLPQVGNVFSNLSVKENLLMAGYTLGKEELYERLRETLDLFPILRVLMRRKAYTLSGGERQILAMAMALMRRPRLIMLDEPTANLAPKISEYVFSKIKELRNELAISILLVEQNAKRALSLGDRAYLMVAGKIVFEGEAKELLQHDKLGRMYLGIGR